MGASKKTQMSTFDEDWADQMWAAVTSVNNGKGAAWRLAVATLAVTGCRPAALERGVVFSLVRDARGVYYMQATIPGVKLTKNRGQPEHSMRWRVEEDTHRPAELMELTKAMMASADKRIVVSCDAEGISTRLREMSRRLWPRRRYAITAYCYRELFASTAKAAGVEPAELAIAMGHRSAESQGAYARAGRTKRRSRAPWASVSGSVPIRIERAPMARFKAASSLKRKMRVAL